jgi:hypothetical protein
MYMTGDTAIIRILRTTKFSLKVNLNRRLNHCTLHAVHSLFPCIRQLFVKKRVITFEDETYGSIVPKFIFTANPPIRFSHLTSLMLDDGVVMQRTTETFNGFIRSFPKLGQLRMRVTPKSLGLLIDALSLSNMADLDVCVEEQGTPDDDIALSVDKLPVGLTSLKLDTANPIVKTSLPCRLKWPSSLTKLHLNAEANLAFVASLPSTLESLVVALKYDYRIDDDCKRNVIPYSAFPSSLTYIDIDHHVCLLDKRLNPGLTFIKAKIQWHSNYDLSKFALPLPGKMQCNDHDWLARLALNADDATKFILHELPPSIDKFELVNTICSVEDNDSYKAASLFRCHPWLPRPQVECDDETWYMHMWSLIYVESWSSSLEYVDIDIVRWMMDDVQLRRTLVSCLLDNSKSQIVKLKLGQNLAMFGAEFVASVLQKVRTLPHLQTLHLAGKLDGEQAWSLLESPILRFNLTTLKIDSDYTLRQSLLIAENLPALRRLKLFVKLDTPNDNSEEVSLRNIGAHCPDLQEVSIRILHQLTASRWLDQSFAQFLPPKLRRFKLYAYGLHYHSEHFACDVFLRLPRTLKELDLSLEFARFPKQLSMALKPRSLIYFKIRDLSGDYN